MVLDSSQYDSPEIISSELFDDSVELLNEEPPECCDGELQRRVDNNEDQIDSLVASALTSLTLEEREGVYLEQHGVTEDLKEDPNMVSQRLEELQVHLQKLKQKRHVATTAFELAEATNPGYCQDRTFHLRFLRTENFKSKSAAARMMRFFELKRYLFGDDKLSKTITLKDLTDDDVHALKQGFFQLLPSRDSAGRVVSIMFPQQQHYKTPESLVGQKNSKPISVRNSLLTFVFLSFDSNCRADYFST